MALPETGGDCTVAGMRYQEMLRANISAELGRAGWTRSQAGKVLGLQPSSFSAKLHGRNEFKFGEVVILAAELGIPFARLIEGIEDTDEMGAKTRTAVTPA